VPGGALAGNLSAIPAMNISPSFLCRAALASLLPLLADSARALEAAAVISEIHYNGAAPGDPEWIELTNRLSIDVDLSGWKLAGGANYTFPAGTTLQAGGFLVISDNPAALQTAAGITGVLGPWTGSLNNSGETLRLRDLSGRLMEEVTYNDRGRWPSGADGSGATLSRKGGHTRGDLADGWELSKRVGGSPGAANDAVQQAPPVTVFGDGSAWLYNDTSPGLAVGWQSTAYTAGTDGWLSGTGALVFEDASLPVPMGTALATPVTHPTGTYYFQKQFALSGDPTQHQFTLRTLFDDGAVIYVNGQEVARRNMPAGPVTAATISPGEVGNAAFTDVKIPSSALVSGTNTVSVEVHQAGRLIVPAAGGGGPLTLVQTGGAIMATNYSTAAGATPFAKDVIPAAPTHTIAGLNNGTYGNSSSWIGNSLNSFCGISFGQSRTLGSVAWGRDNTGTYSDRTAGNYTLQYTTAATVNAATPEASWITIGSVTHTASNALRNVYSFTSVTATGIRLICPGNSFANGACVDELEAGPYIAAPPPPAPVFKLMATGGNMDTATNMALSATPFAKDLVGNGAYAPTHSIAGINDGVYGNPNSWIGETSGSYAGVSFPTLRQIGRVAWGRDNTGNYPDRAEGVYTVQYTTVLNPTNATPAGSWTTIGTIIMDSTVGSPALRHVLEFAPVNASGIRIITPGAGVGSGACIDELEIYAPVNPDVVWSAELTSREIIPPAAATGIVINEIGGALDGVWRLELKNTGSAPFDLGGLILAGSDAPLAGYTLPAQMLAAGAVLVLDETQLGFRPGEDDRFFLYSAARGGVADSVIVRANGRARSADGKMLVPTGASFGAENAFAFNSDIVINEVMYHFPGASGEEWIELYNKSASPVDVSGWQLDDAVTFTIPGLLASNTTVIPAGGYLVIANNAAVLAAKWPGITILGNFSGSLNNRGERISLEDANGNPVDELTYADGGKWPPLADGGGSSLELRDTAADNAHPASWTASDESAKSTMQTFTYRLTSTQPLGPSFWNEFRLGMLDAGVCYLDDLSVKRDPDGAAVEVIQNGSFANANAWRILGNHGGSGVVADGANGSVLRIAATGPAETNHNHLETTFAGNTALVNNALYEVSFKARWISGSNRLGTRGYYSRIAKAHELPIPQNLGTPGAANSTIGIAGPSLSDLRHSPVMPSASQPVTVTCTAGDSRPVTDVTLNYSTGGAFTQVPMTASGGAWSATIPGQAAGSVIQFYVSATNSAGGTSMLPAAGAASRALCLVNDGQTTTVAAREFRVIMFPAESAAMVSSPNLLSNALTGGTLVVGGTDIFYDVGVRLQGSAAGRARDVLPAPDYRGFNVELPGDEKYMGLYSSVGFDRSGRAPANRRPDEIYAKHLFHRAGLPATRDDLAWLTGPTPDYTGVAILQLHSYGGDFSDDQFGTEGSIFNFDGTYEPTTNSVSGDVQSLKNPVPFTHHQTDLVNLGDKEHYRGFFDIRGGKERDDYAPLMAMCTAMGLPAGAQFDAGTDALIDVDQWMRCTALVNLLVVQDSWFTGGFPHNARFWVPSTGKAVQLPWDMDFMVSAATNSPINMTNGNLGKLVGRPNNQRAYFAHIRDLCLTVLDPAYVQTWLAHYGSVTSHNYAAQVSWLNARRTYALSVLPASVPFAIATNGGADFSVNAHTITLTGTGWLDIRSIRRNGSVIPLNIRWTNNTTWTAEFALISGENVITLDALDANGSTLSSDNITITNTLPVPQPRDFLRITEVHYNPADPSTPAETAVSLDNDEFEFIELINTGTGTLDLTGVRFTQGIAFTFPPAFTLAGGARVLVVKNTAAFTARYGAGHNVAGTYPLPNLSNTGETLTLVDATGVIIQMFAYDDDWAPLSDGGGRSLIIRDPSGPLLNWQSPGGWALGAVGGTPGAGSGAGVFTEFTLWQHTHFDSLQLTDPLVSGPSADPTGHGVSNFMRYALGITPADNALDFLPVVSTAGGLLRMEFRRAKGAVDVAMIPEFSSGLSGWAPLTDFVIVTGDNGDGSENLRLETSQAPVRRLVRVRLQQTP